MKMLRWILGVPKMGHVHNELFKGSVKVIPMIEMLGEFRLRWFGMRKEDWKTT